MIQKLGKYALVEMLGEGAMGAVYKAYDEILDRYVAIKTMAEDIKWDPELKLRFYREARSAASLHHPNIVTIHDLGEEGKITYIVMELLEGSDLRDVIKNRSPLSFEKKITIISQVAEGLSHAHHAGIIHRDIKPGNIHLSPAGAVKLMDFGIARIPSSDLTRSGVRLGTPIYMSPEQIRGETYDERSDMFSCGIVFYELFAYSHPFRDKNIAKTLDNILFQNRYDFEEQCPEAPPGLWPIIGRCIEKDPAKRYSSMAEVAKDCRSLLVELNFNTQRMAADLQNALPRLQQAAAHPKAPPSLLALLEEARNLFAREERPDYLSLRRALQGLAAESTFLQSLPQAAGAQARVSPEAASSPSVPSTAPAAGELLGKQLFGEARELLQAGRLEEAQEKLAKVSELLGQREEVAQALAEVRHRIEERTLARIAPLLEEARRSVHDSRFAAAVGMLDEVLRAVPGHPEAVELRGRALSGLEEERIRAVRKVEGNREKSAGIRLLADGNFRESIARLKRAAELLADDPDIANALRQAEEGARAGEFRRSLEAGRQEAQALLRQGNPDAALKRIRRTLELAPEDPEAIALQEQIRQALEEQQKAERIAGLLAEGREHLRRQDFEPAYACARSILEIEPNHSEANNLLESIDRALKRKETQDAVAASLEQARAALAREDFHAAAQFCQEALNRDPQSPAARDLLAAVSRAEEEKRREERITHLLADGQKALLREDPDGAETFAKQALELNPQHHRAHELMRRIADTRKKRIREEIAALIARGRQELGRGEFQASEDLGQQALKIDPESIEARNFLAAVEQAKEARRQEEIATLLERARQAMQSGEFAEATNQGEAVLSLDPGNTAARALLKSVKRELRNREKQQAREEKRRLKEEKRQARAARAATAHTAGPAAEAGDMDRTVLLEKPVRRRPSRAVIVSCAGALVVILAVVAAWRLKREGEPAPDIPSLISTAQSSLDRGLFDEAIATAQQVLSAAPENTQAKALLLEGERRKTSQAISTLLLEAQNYRSENRREDSLEALARILELDPANESALAVQAQIEAEMAAEKSTEEQQAAVVEWVENARRMIAAGKLAAAQAELDKIAGIQPDAPELPAMRKQIASRRAAATMQAKVEQELAQKQKRMEEWSGQAEDLFQKGRYAEAESSLTQWLAASPQDVRALTLKNRAAQAMRSLNVYESTMAEKRYDEALKAVAQLEKINAVDPAIPEMRKRAEARKAAARAIISVFRLGAPASLTLDDEPIGIAGELENMVISAGRHKLAAVFANGKQSSRTADLVEGQRASFVYDAASMELRPMTDPDRALLARRQTLEEVHSYEVEHRHLLGKCTGTLLISGISVEYRGSDKGHSFTRPFNSLKLEVKDDKVEMNAVDGRQSWTFKARDAAQAREIGNLWNTLLELRK
jgi:serine/threonine protein kinase